MNFFTLLAHAVKSLRRPAPTSRPVRRPGAALFLEELEERKLPSAATISGFVFNDVNNNGLYDPGESPIANNPIALLNANGVVIGRAVTNGAGFYAFTTDSSVSTSPKTESFTVSFPTNKTNQSQLKSLPQFDPSLGTLTAIDLSINGQITSDIKVENQDPSPALIDALISGALNLAGPDFNTQVTTSSSTKSFNASAWDHVNDFGGTSGKDFGNVTVNGSRFITLTGAQALADFSGAGAVGITETAQATSSASGGGNLLVNISSTGSASLTVTYHYTPGNALKPGNYTIVQTAEPPGYLNGLFSRNGQVLPPNPGPGPDEIPITLTGPLAPNNDFGELLPNSDLGIVKAANPNPVLVNAALTYTLTVTNYGPMTAGNVRVQDALPPGVAFVNAVGLGWNFAQAGGTVTGTLPSLAPGASSVITITVTAPASPGYITNTAVVSSSTPDSNPGNNQSSVTTRVVVPSVVLSQAVVPPFNFPNFSNASVLGKQDFLAITGSGNADPTLMPQVAWVDTLYRALLNRDADPAGLVGFVRLLRTGGGPAQVVQALWNSDEHRALEINQLYQQFLHRPVDPAGMAIWLNAFHAGLTETGMARMLLVSAEYQGAHPSDAAFITGLYQDVLGDAVDPSALAYWEQVLQGGTSRDAVAGAFLGSDEEYLNVINQTYENILRRPADPGAQAFWLAQFRAGQVNPATFSMALLTSPEFFNLVVQNSLG